MLDPNAGATKWGRNLGSSTESIKAGVNAVSVAPTSQAAAAADKWQSRLTSPDAKAKFVSSLNGVSLSDWQNSMINTGIPRIAGGVAKGQGKYQTFATKFYPFVANVQATIAKMPSTTLEDNIARMTAAVRSLATYKG